jgi:hypothetical protein
MSSELTAARPSTVVSPLSRKNKVGLVLAGLLSLGDLVGPFTVPTNSADDAGPPMAVLIASAVLGVVTLIAIFYTWRSGDRVSARVVAGSRILSALTSLPAFFVGDVAAGVVVTVAASVVVTILAVGLVLARPAESSGAQ